VTTGEIVSISGKCDLFATLWWADVSIETAQTGMRFHLCPLDTMPGQRTFLSHESGSIGNADNDLQLEGTAAEFHDPAIQAAITSGPAR